MKFIILTLMFCIVLCSLTYADLDIVNNIVSLERNESNSFCDSNEYPVFDSDCDDNNAIFFTGWFWKLLLLSIIILAFYNEKILQNNIFWIVLLLLIIGVFAISYNANKTETFINQQNYSDIDNNDLYIPTNSFESFLDKIFNLPTIIGGKGNETFGWFVLIILGIIIIPVIRVILDKVEGVIKK